MATSAGTSWATLEGTRFEEREFERLWLLAAATYGVGDVVTSVALIWFSATVREGNPVVRLAVDLGGQAGLVTLKIAVFLVCIAVSLYASRAEDDDLLYYTPPLVLATVGTIATLHNLHLLSL